MEIQELITNLFYMLLTFYLIYKLGKYGLRNKK